MRLSDIFNKVDALDPVEAQQLISDDKSVILLDVREPREYEEEHIPGAVLMPMSSLPDKMKELDPSRTIVAY
jgi:rhodanese-related sulfurtransferase